jgi:hypothetical protein
MNFHRFIASFFSLCSLVHGRVSTGTHLQRKRFSPDIFGETYLGKSADDFGKIMHEASTLNYDMERFKEWNRILEDTSFSFTSECNFDLKLECYLASDRNVSSWE